MLDTIIVVIWLIGSTQRGSNGGLKADGRGDGEGCVVGLEGWGASVIVI